MSDIFSDNDKAPTEDKPKYNTHFNYVEFIHNGEIKEGLIIDSNSSKIGYDKEKRHIHKKFWYQIASYKDKIIYTILEENITKVITEFNYYFKEA